MFTHSFTTCVFYVCFFFSLSLFFKVEINSSTLTPLFRPGSVHSGSAKAYQGLTYSSPHSTQCGCCTSKPYSIHNHLCTRTCWSTKNLSSLKKTTEAFSLCHECRYYRCLLTLTSWHFPTRKAMKAWMKNWTIRDFSFRLFFFCGGGSFFLGVSFWKSIK